MNNDIYQYVKIRRDNGMHWGEISRLLYLTFNVRYSVMNLKMDYQNHGSETMKRRYVKLDEYKNFILESKKEGMSYKDIADAIEAIEGQRPSDSGIRRLVKLAATTETVLLEEPVEAKIVLSDFNDLEESEKEYANTRCRWSYQDELMVLVDFYNLSVDEAREKFQRPYYAIAKRLEQINDLTEPYHSELLMEAARIIETRKASVVNEAPMTRRERRRMRRIARKAARVQKRLDRLSTRYGVRFEEVKDSE